MSTVPSSDRQEESAGDSVEASRLDKPEKQDEPNASVSDGPHQLGQDGSGQRHLLGEGGSGQRRLLGEGGSGQQKKWTSPFIIRSWFFSRWKFFIQSILFNLGACRRSFRRIKLWQLVRNSIATTRLIEWCPTQRNGDHFHFIIVFRIESMQCHSLHLHGNERNPSLMTAFVHLLEHPHAGLQHFSSAPHSW